MKARLALALFLAGVVGTYSAHADTPVPGTILPGRIPTPTYETSPPPEYTPTPAPHLAVPPGATPAPSESISIPSPCPSACTSACPPAPCQTPACPCPTPSRKCTFELDTEILHWWTKPASVPPLATTSEAADLGIIGRPTTRTVLGDRDVTFDPRIGARFAGRLVLDGGWGVLLDGFWLENGSERNNVSGLPVLALPTINPDSGASEAVRLAGPGASTGSASFEMGSRFWGADACALYRFQNLEDWKVDAFAGFRYLSLDESLKLRTNTTILGAGLFNGQVTPPGSTYDGEDSFGTRNSFYGAQVGARVSTNVLERLVVQAQAQIALGATQQRITVEGDTTLRLPNGTTRTAPGNVYSQTSNIDRLTRYKTAYSPQVGLSLGYQVTDWARFTFGYDFLYWNSVLRPGNQIDRQVTPSLPPIQNDGVVVGTLRPEPQLGPTDFWVQGLSFGLQLAY